jgi:hypothetical protein
LNRFYLNSCVGFEVEAFDVSDDQPGPVVVEGQSRRRRRGDVQAIDVDSSVLVLQMSVLIDYLK